MRRSKAKRFHQKISTALFLGAVSLFAMASSPAISEPLSIESLAQFEALTSVSISPNGKHVVGLVAAPNQKWPVISVWNADDLSKTPVWIPSATNRIISVGFLGDEKIYFITEQPITRQDGKLSFTNKLYITDLEGRRFEEPFKRTGTRNKEIRELMDKGITISIFNSDLYQENEILISTTNPENFSTEIYKYNIVSGDTELVAREGEEWSFNSEGVDLNTGELLIRQKSDTDRDGKFHLFTEIKDRTTNQWVEHPELGYKFEDRVDLEILGFDTDPNLLLIRTNRGQQYSAVYNYDIRNKRFVSEPLFSNANFNIGGVNMIHSKSERRVIDISSISVMGPAPTQVWLDPTWSAVYNTLKATFPNKNVYLSPNKEDRTRAIVTVEAPDLPPEYYLFSNGRLAKLGSERPWIAPSSLGRTEFTTFKARDGLDIPAFVTYPPNYNKDSDGRKPVVVLPHGGPWSRDTLTWDSTGWTQFLATRGVIVIQPQYRGSDGFSDRLWKAGDNEWGQKMSDDNDDAAAYLVSQGVGDSSHMAIFGYSYGGFAAIAASVRPNSPYRCAIAGAGVSSLKRIGNLWGGDNLAREIQGHTVDGMDPIENVRNANIPIMLYHGSRDRQADTEHSRLFNSAMRNAGKDVEYHEIDGMWHTLPWNPQWHRQTLGYIEEYFKSDKCNILPR